MGVNRSELPVLGPGLVTKWSERAKAILRELNPDDLSVSDFAGRCVYQFRHPSRFYRTAAEDTHAATRVLQPRQRSLGAALRPVS